MESAIELSVPLEADETKAKYGMKPNKIEFTKESVVGDFSVSPLLMTNPTIPFVLLYCL